MWGIRFHANVSVAVVAVVVPIPVVGQFEKVGGLTRSLAKLHRRAMPKQSSKKPKRPTDPNLLALAIVAEATGSPMPVPLAETAPEPTKEKNPAAVALGRLGGANGGPARAAALSAKKRKEIAKNAAAARWGEKKKPS